MAEGDVKLNLQDEKTDKRRESNEMREMEPIIIDKIKEEASKEVDKIKKKALSKVEQFKSSVSNARILIIKIITNALILFIAVQSFISYMKSSDGFDGYKGRLKHPLLTDIYLISDKEICNDGYSKLSPVTFPEVNEGCLCDDKILKKKDCDFIIDKFIAKNKTEEQKKAILDNLLYSCSNQKTLRLLEDSVVNTETQTTQATPSPTETNSNPNPQSEPTQEQLQNPDYVPPSTSNHVDESGNVVNQKEFYMNPNDPDYSFPGSEDFYSKSGEITTKYENGVAIAANSKGIPFDIVPMEEYPKKCKCFKNIDSIDKVELSSWSGQSLCMKYDKSQTTETYLKSVSKFRTCKLANRCQKYFCKEDNQTCPIIDAQLIFNDNNKTFTLLKSSSNSIIPKYGMEYLKSTIIPMTNVSSVLSGPCSNNSQNVIHGFSYPLVNDTTCSASQITSSISSITLKTLLNSNGNLFETYSKLPQFKKYIDENTNYHISGFHAFGKDSMTCFLTNQLVNETLSHSLDKGFGDTLNVDLIKINNIVFLFAKLEEYFKLEKGVQLFMVVSNAFNIFLVSLVAFVSFFSCIIPSFAKKFNEKMKIFMTVLSTLIDLAVLAVSLYSFISIYKVSYKIEVLYESGCLDEGTNKELLQFMDKMVLIAKNSSEIFAAVLFKLVIVLVSYIICIGIDKYNGKKVTCKGSFQILKESLIEVFTGGKAGKGGKGEKNKDDENENEDEDAVNENN